MGDLRDCSPEPNGVVLEESPPRLSLPSQTVSAEYWQRAEEATQGVIAQVQPTDVSERRRRAVIEYVQRLIRGCIGCEVFPFGSVPLKTYLPDGDIDLTAFGGLNVAEALANDVCAVLEREEQNMAAEFMVKDVQLIRAEVKLVKCLVQNIVVDISFNQLGGLCTLCFLEQVDRLIGKDHLFKRSIILIKAWCYYESRILGAHHGLISTYGLETLVLHIFHLFHTSLNGPLAVLYKFLDYFSKFDWDTYCISLNGPVRISSLPEMLAEMPDNNGGELLLSNEFLRWCVEMFSVPSRGYETNCRTFLPKHLNIVDPLKENNNLGRSVSKGNFYRIRSAFTYGARKLGRIISQPEENIDDEIRKFFANTLDGHGSGQRPDNQDPIPLSGYDGFGVPFAPEFQEDNVVYESEAAYRTGMVEESGLSYDGSWDSGAKCFHVHGQPVNGLYKSETDTVPQTTIQKTEESSNEIGVSEFRLLGDAEDLATSRFQELTISNDAQKLSPSRCEVSISPLGKAELASHQWEMGNGDVSSGDGDHKLSECLGSAEDGVGNQDENQVSCNEELVAPVVQKHQLSRLHSIVGSSEDFYPSYGVSEFRLLGDAEDLATSRFQELTISNDAQKLSPSRCEVSISPLGKAELASHQWEMGNGDVSSGDGDHKLSECLGSAEDGVGNQDENQVSCNEELVAPVVQKHQLSRLHSIVGSSEDFYPSYSGYRMSFSTTASSETSNPLSNLSGEYDNHLHSLHYGRSCYDYELNAVHHPMPPPMPTQYQRSKSWDVSRQSVPLRHNAYPPLSPNGVVPRQAFYHMTPPLLPNGAGFGVEEMPKARGTGTYFPNTNHYRDRPMSARGRNQAPLRSPRNNGHAIIPPPESGFPERSSRELSQAQMSLHRGGGKFGSPESPTSSPRTKVYPNVNGSIHSDQIVESGPVERLPLEAPPMGRHTKSGSSVGQNVSVSEALTNSEVVIGQDRISVQSYRLKDEEDFPPLSA